MKQEKLSNEKLFCHIFIHTKKNSVPFMHCLAVVVVVFFLFYTLSPFSLHAVKCPEMFQFAFAAK